MSYNKAVIFVANGVQDEEFLYPYYRLQEAGFSLDVVHSVEDRNQNEVRGKYGIPIKITRKSDGLLDKDYDILIIPGGWQCPEILRQDLEIVSYIRNANSKGKIIGAICHGPQVLISAGICRGRKLTCYKGMADDLKNSGANYVESDLVIDQNIITSPHYKDNPKFMRAVLESYENYRLGHYV